MNLKIKKHDTGVAVYDDSNLILLSKGLNYLIPHKRIKIVGHEPIPTKEVLQIAISKSLSRLPDIELLGNKYRFIYTLTDIGLVSGSVLAEEYYFASV